MGERSSGPPAVVSRSICASCACIAPVRVRTGISNDAAPSLTCTVRPSAVSGFPVPTAVTTAREESSSNGAGPGRAVVAEKPSARHAVPPIRRAASASGRERGPAASSSRAPRPTWAASASR